MGPKDSPDAAGNNGSGRDNNGDFGAGNNQPKPPPWQVPKPELHPELFTPVKNDPAQGGSGNGGSGNGGAQATGGHRQEEENSRRGTAGRGGIPGRDAPARPAPSPWSTLSSKNANAVKPRQQRRKSARSAAPSSWVWV